MEEHCSVWAPQKWDCSRIDEEFQGAVDEVFGGQVLTEVKRYKPLRRRESCSCRIFLGASCILF